MSEHSDWSVQLNAVAIGVELGKMGVEIADLPMWMDSDNIVSTTEQMEDDWKKALDNRKDGERVLFDKWARQWVAVMIATARLDD